MNYNIAVGPIQLSNGESYGMEDAVAGRPIPDEVLQKCNNAVLKTIFNAMEATMEYAEEQVAKVRSIIQITETILDASPSEEKQKKLDELKAAVDDLSTYMEEMTGQQERIALTLAERGEFPGEPTQEPSP